MSRVVVLALALAGCGFRIGGGSGAEDGGPGDGVANDGIADGPDDGPPPVDDAPIDGPPQPATCIAKWLAHTITFETPAPLTTVNTTSYERDPFVSPDELTLWFSNGGGDSLGGGDVFVAKRANKTLPFGQVGRDTSFSSTDGAESKVSINTAGTFAVVASTKAGGSGGVDIWETSRSNAQASWQALSRAHVSGLDTVDAEYDPFLTPDGLHLYFAPGTPAPQHLVVASRATVNDNFGAPTNVGGVNTTSGEADPTVFASDRVIVFASSRTSVTHGGVNIWYATRAGNTGAFGTPLEVPNVNSNDAEGDPHVTADGCGIYFARFVPGGADYELFSAVASP